ncbi:MAG: hypothetical protein KAI39_09325 [Desulfobulbaceae bacterium]|nr:hypothetical protein [Desulfobulbaceae bacterium]
MTTKTAEKKSQLIASLREGVAVVQMVLFKEIKARLMNKLLSKNQTFLSMLAGSVTNEVFGSQNPEKKFETFRQEHMGEIEQELLSLRTDMPKLCAKVTDALRIQTLCDHQEGEDSSETLIRAKESGILIEEREVPLPSAFMTIVRLLGEEHNLIVPPVQITPEQDQSIIH